MKYLARKTLLVSGFVLILTGCSLQEPASFHAAITPRQGHVPYEATITVAPVGYRYVYRLPNETIETTETEQLVLVDTLVWAASIECIRDEETLATTVEARGTNALPQISRPRINSDAYLWQLKPLERTLIDFSCHPGSSFGPRTGIEYDGSCWVTSIRVLPSEQPYAYSIFYPPYEAGKCHAMYRGVLHENACIVYPHYASQQGPGGLPYSPTHLDEGYPSAARSMNLYQYTTTFKNPEIEIAEQLGTIEVSVKDEFGRFVGATFSIPISALTYTD